MSWSFSAVGKPAAVAKAARAEAEVNRCSEPEESIRKTTLNTIATIADNTVATYALKAEASGSQSVNNGVVQTNQLRILVEPIWNFLE